MVGLILITGVSFWDDVKSLPDRIRLVAQFLAMGLAAWGMIQGSELMALEWYWLVLIGIAALIVFVGARTSSTLWMVSMVSRRGMRSRYWVL